MKKIVLAIVAAMVVTGCATAPESAVTAKSLKAENVIYFEQSDRIPKDVLLSVNQRPKLVAALSALPADKLVELVKELLVLIPEVTKSYNEERMFNALLGRRMLFIGYKDPEQLKAVKEIVDSMTNAIEFVTPRGTGE